MLQIVQKEEKIGSFEVFSCKVVSVVNTPKGWVAHFWDEEHSSRAWCFVEDSKIPQVGSICKVQKLKNGRCELVSMDSQDASSPAVN